MNWTPISMPPTHPGPYLVYCGDDSEGHPIRLVAKYEDGVWTSAGNTLPFEVSHWCVLPEVPKEAPNA
ncbi:hypothetical protein [Singulisphaera sp. GP187]|uniref:hypothetical protein n=1 Tax=Singulisphaera sp. GP187 TaxID=1882752 RepID=UPI001160F9F4|nr:hypothetical protein [Singulisphaera sp. GP187]